MERVMLFSARLLAKNWMLYRIWLLSQLNG